MAYGQNRAAARPRSSFQTAGGIIMKYRHPYLSGQISGATPIDEIDVSRSVKLNDQFIDANPSQDSAYQEVLVDGSTITITNHLLAGTMTLPVLPTTGLVGSGDFIAALQLVKASKDSVGGTFTIIEEIQGKRIITVFYGVAVKNVPDYKKAGNSVVPYPVTLMYSGWVKGVSGDAQLNEKTIWAVGNKYGLKGVYKPYLIQEAENQNDFFGGAPLSIEDGAGIDEADSASGDFDNIVDISTPAASYPNVDLDPDDPNPTWS